MRKSLHTGLTAGMLAMGIIAAPSFAEIKVNDQLSLNGFIDMSTTAGLPDVGPMTATATFDQFELDFMYKFSDKLSARVDLNSLGGGATVFEQGFISYAASSDLTIQAGKFLSTSGWEAAEPTGMYQYSYSDAFVYGGYQNGVNVSYTVSPMISLYGAVVDGIWNPDGDIKRAGLEGQVALMPTKEITAKVTGMYEQEVGYGKTVLNAWGSYVMGPLTAAVEADYLMNYRFEDDNGFGYLVMSNYKLTDAFAVTGRFSGISLSDNGLAPANPAYVGEVTQNEITISPSLALLSNWLILAEAKYQLDDSNKGLGLAVETTVTF